MSTTSSAEAAPKQRPAQPALPIETIAAPVGPLLAVISINAQRLTVYDRNGRVLQSPVSSGQVGFETPTGVFSIIERNKEHFSNLYNDAPMPNMQRITWSGVALHAGNLPGYRASHGCIRIPLAVSERLFELTKLGTRVIVANDEVEPIAFSHPGLFSVIPDTFLARQLPESDAASTIATASPSGPMSSVISLPMMLGATLISAANASDLRTEQAQQTSSEMRPISISKAAWAAELASRVPATDRDARTTKSNAIAASKAAHRATAARIASETARSATAAKVAKLETAVAKARTPDAIRKLEHVKISTEGKLQDLVYTTDRLRAEEAASLDAANSATNAAAVAANTRLAAAKAARDAYRQLKPVSVFISRKSGRLYARQGFQPLFDVTVTIKHPTEPIGTHVYTAIEERKGTDEMLWSVVTVVDGQPAPPLAAANIQSKRLSVRDTSQSVAPRSTAAAALDRIEIPDDVRQRIGALMIPGSSLIISDQGISEETGKGTDFIVLTP